MSRNIVDQAELITKLSNYFGDNLHLTGSHLFGGVTDDSDVDFFIQSHEKTGEILSQLGFIRTQDSLYLDDNTLVVWRHLLLHIDIQFVKDVKLKTIAQELILEQYDQFSFTPAQWRKIWNKAFRQVKLVINIMQQNQKGR